MRLGLTLPNLGSIGTRDNLMAYAREAEQLGYNSLWVTDRLLFPVQPKQLMMGQPWSPHYKFVLDPLDALVWAAAAGGLRMNMLPAMCHSANAGRVPKK